MIRFILKVKSRNEITGYCGEHLYTIDNDLVALEAALRRGGSGEYGYEAHELIGVEVLDVQSLSVKS